MQFQDTGVFRDLNTGVDPMYGRPWDADGALDAAGDPGAPIDTRVEGGSAMVLPWWEGLEDPEAPIEGLPFIQSPEPTYPNESVGAQALPGAYEPAFRTHGPVYQWGHEVSGGPYGDQAVGRIMRFPANIPDRYDPNGVQNRDWRDALAASLAANNSPVISDGQVTDDLLQWPNVSDY